MKISELIEELNELKKEYGDIECAIFDTQSKDGSFQNYVSYVDVIEYYGEFLVRL